MMLSLDEVESGYGDSLVLKGVTLTVAAGQTLSGIPDIGHLLLTTREGRPVYVQDVARTLIGPAPLDQRVWHMARGAEGPWSSVPAISIALAKRALDKAGWKIGEVDLFEINEAFACVAMFSMHDLGIPHEKINVNGGATALGHPIGASGTRIITTLIGALKNKGLKRGVASLCIGGGEATAVAIELV